MKIKTLNLKGVIAQLLFIFVSVVILRLDIPLVQEYGAYIWTGSCIFYTRFTVKFGVDVMEI